MTDAPVLSIKVPSKLLRALTKGAKEAGMSRAAFIRMLLEHGLGVWAEQRAKGIVESIAKELISVQPIPPGLLYDLGEALGDGGIPLSCDSFVSKPKPC